MKFWIYIEKELSELQTDFEKIFDVNNLYHDYENVWEWIESRDRETYVYLNISRTHDGDKGEYDQPIMIYVESNRGDELDERETSMKIKNQLKCDVFAGEITVDNNDRAVIGEYRKY